MTPVVQSGPFFDVDAKYWKNKLTSSLRGFRYRIGPFEVENALIEHEAVAESAVVSSPDPIRGEVRTTAMQLSQ